jgi:large subunit ribosomal protein L4
MKYPVYNSQGDKVKEIELSSRIFGVKVKPEVIHQVVVAQQASARQVLAHTKTKDEVRGGGKKPWKQKGTGRARHGSSRSPIWVGGGITFGPRNDRNFTKAVNQKQKQLAMAMCLSDKVNDKTLAVFDKLAVEAGKTKALAVWLKEIKSKIETLKNSKKFLLILENNNKSVISSALNLKNVNTILADSLNCVDLLKYDTVLASEKALEVINKHYKLIKEKKS